MGKYTAVIIVVIFACAIALWYLLRGKGEILPTPPPTPTEGGAETMYMANVPMPVANTEYIWQVPTGTKKFILHVREGTAIRIATEPNKVAGLNEPYFTLHANSSCSQDDLNVKADSFLYFACAAAGKTVEIMVGA